MVVASDDIAFYENFYILIGEAEGTLSHQSLLMITVL